MLRFASLFTVTRMHARRSRNEWQQIIRAFERSGQTHEGFCAARNINVGSFRNWVYELRRKTPTPAPPSVKLVPVRVPTVVDRTVVGDDAATVVVVVADVELRVPAGVDPAYVGSLVRELRRC